MYLGSTKVDFRDCGKRTETAKLRATAFWLQRCPPDVEIIVVRASTFRHWMERDSTPCSPGGRIVGAASITGRAIGVPTESLRQPDWQLVLEHELLHILQPELSDVEVELQATRNVAEHPINF